MYLILELSFSVLFSELSGRFTAELKADYRQVAILIWISSCITGDKREMLKLAFAADRPTPSNLYEGVPNADHLLRGPQRSFLNM